MDALAQFLGDAAGDLARSIASPYARNGVLALAVGWVIGGFAFRHYFGRENFSIAAYLRHAFPARVYRSRTFAVDVQVFLLGRLVEPLRLITLVFSVSAVAAALAGGLAGLLGPVQAGAPGTIALVFMAVLLLLAFDLGTYVTHRLSHRVPVLWAFHRLHHSAEALNPLTLERKHPVYTLLSVLIDCAIVAPVQAVILYLFGAEANLAVVGATNLGFVAFAYCAASLRHTHIWLSYGPVLDRILVSPALHQIHHSQALHHWDRNYGEVLAIWDWMFGSLYLPRDREELTFGIGDGEAQPHTNIVNAMLEPFAYAWMRMRGAKPASSAPKVPESQAGPV